MPPAVERPADSTKLRDAVDASRAGRPFKAVLEELLRALEPSQADAMMLRIKESRGTWSLLAEPGGGRALFLGDPLSGTVTALAFLGFQVTIVDGDPGRITLAMIRDRSLAGGRARAVRAVPARLPFVDRGFDLVAAELPGGGGFEDSVLGELRRVCKGSLALVADNRLAYKRSTGLRGTFRVPGPLEWIARVARPESSERTLAAYRRLISGEASSVRAFALYPDARDFSHVVSLDGPRPALTIGPKERQNKLKMAARAAGLFRHFTPSFAILSSRQRGGEPRLERILSQLAERLEEPAPEADVLVATRSNVALVLTAPAGRAPDGGAGCWSLHIPLGPQKADMTRRHFGFLERIRGEFPAIPVPEPLFLGELDGVLVSCERRLPGLSAPQITGDRERTRRLYGDPRKLAASLILGPASPLSEEEYERFVADRFRFVGRQCAVPETERRIERAVDSARERLVGTSFPRVLYHADLRSKHVQIREDGSVLGILDWGASEEEFLPYVDLAHLVGHQRKQELDCSPAESWRMLRERDLQPHERELLEGYAADLSLPRELVEVVEEFHPLFVAGMAERNWDYSRPRWVHRQFGF